MLCVSHWHIASRMPKARQASLNTTQGSLCRRTSCHHTTKAHQVRDDKLFAFFLGLRESRTVLAGIRSLPFWLHPSFRTELVFSRFGSQVRSVAQCARCQRASECGSFSLTRLFF